jgi:transcriptional regulator with XRE-family HTH domain
MLTPFGKAFRKIRIDRNLRLFDVACALGKSSAFLSAVETGKKQIPGSLPADLERALKLSNSEYMVLVAAADQTRRSVPVAGLSPRKRELVATLARRADELTDEQLKEIRLIIGPVFEARGHETPFERRRGFLVPPRAAEAIWKTAEGIRQIFVAPECLAFPIIDVLEMKLHRMQPEFVLQVYERADMDGDEGRAIPEENTIVLAEDVYLAACNGDGRARFTACHELGHLLLHGQTILSRSSDGYEIFRDAEWQADCFAGALLVSRAHCEESWTTEDVASKFQITRHAAEVMRHKYLAHGMRKKNSAGRWNLADAYRFFKG